MAITCGKLNMGVLGYDCKNPIVMGVKPTAYIINHDDIDPELTTIDASGVVTDLVLKAGATAYLAESLNDGIAANVAFAKGTYMNGWEHNFVLRIFDSTPKVKKFIEQLSLSRVVVLIENKYVKYNPTAPDIKGETVYELYGFYLGLELNEATKDSTDADTKGGYMVTCGCDENAKEPLLPLTVFNTDLETTRTMIESLV